MKKRFTLWILVCLSISACSGAQSITKKTLSSSVRTFSIVDLSSPDLQDVGWDLKDALWIVLTDEGFEVRERSSNQLKFKVTRFNAGSRSGRRNSMGTSDNSRGGLIVKAAMFKGPRMVGAWTVKAWIKGGLKGGSPVEMVEDAAQQIADHLKGRK